MIRGQPADVLPQLFRDWGTTYFSFEEDPEPYGQVQRFPAKLKKNTFSNFF